MNRQTTSMMEINVWINTDRQGAEIVVSQSITAGSSEHIQLCPSTEGLHFFVLDWIMIWNEVLYAVELIWAENKKVRKYVSQLL